ncbi:MAG: tetratricopeptide repeat protein, partial [Myxococcota bacterium]
VLAGELASDGAGVQVANGLQGIATYNLGQLERADSLLSTAVEGQVSADDRAVFLFNRGKVRLGLQQPGSAAEDLRTASRQIDLSDEIRLDLAVALARIGEIDQAIALTEELLQNNRRGDLSDAMRVHLDSLSRRAPSRAPPKQHRKPGATGYAVAPAFVPGAQRARPRPCLGRGERSSGVGRGSR